MPRDNSGTYTLPAGNPVAPNTVIESTWANPTMSDIASTLTASLDRNGRGTMLAAFKLVDGVQAQPALTWNSEISSGLYRAGSHDIRLAIGGVDQIKATDAGVTFPVGVSALKMSGPLTLSDGTLAAPALTFDSDTTSGWYKLAAGAWGYSSGGVDVFKVAGDSTRVMGSTYGVLGVRDGGVYGGTAPNAARDGIVLESNTHTGISIITPAGMSGGIAFGRPGLPTNGQIIYDHSNDLLTLNCNGATVLALSGSYIAGTQSFRANFTDSVSIPGFAWSSASNTGLFLAGGGIGVTIGGAEKARFPNMTDPQFLVGITSALHGATGRGLIEIGGSSLAALGFDIAGAQATLLSATATTFDVIAAGARAITFNNGGTEKARIAANADAQFLIGTTSAQLASAGRTILEMNGSTSTILLLDSGGTNRGYLFADNTQLQVSTQTLPINIGVAGISTLSVQTGNLAAYQGVEIGWRDLPAISPAVGGTYTLSLADRGKVILSNGTNISVPALNAPAGAVFTIAQVGGTTIQIQQSGGTIWWGTGTTVSGPRTISVGSVITLLSFGSNNFFIKGDGIS